MRDNSNINTAKNSEDSLLESYLQEISSYAPLTDEEESRLSKLIISGDEKAKDKLVKANLKFVVSIARQYANTSINILDLINEGNIALIKSAEKFESDKGQRFFAYAVWNIRKAIEAFLPNEDVHINRAKTETLSGNTDSEDEFMLSDLDRRELAEIIKLLPERERMVLNEYFGITNEQLTMIEIAHRHNLKRERVRQIRNRALRRLNKVKRTFK